MTQATKEKKMQLKAIDQLNQIRKEGNYNMISKNRVIEEANRKNFYDLVNYTTEVHGSRIRVNSSRYFELLGKLGDQDE